MTRVPESALEIARAAMFREARTCDALRNGGLPEQSERASADYYSSNPAAYKKKLAYDKKRNAKPAQRAYRAELARERRSRGIMGKGGKDVSHGKRGFALEDPTHNRARNGHDGRSSKREVRDPLRQGREAYVRAQEPLDEAVMAVHKYTKDGRSLVIDHGKLGWFRVYSVVSDFMTTSLFGHWDLRKERKFSDIVKDLRARGTTAESHGLTSLDRAAKRVAQDTSAALQRVGFPKRQDVMLLTDLSKRANAITGRGVGGLAYRKEHALEVSQEMAVQRPLDAIYVAAHEWGHKWLFQAPSHIKQYVNDYFRGAVLKVVEPEKPIPGADIKNALAMAIPGAFDSAWRAQFDGTTVNAILRGLREGEKGSSRALIVLRSGGVVYGRLSKAHKRWNKSKGQWAKLRARDLVRAHNSDVGSFILVAPRSGSAASRRPDAGFVKLSVEEFDDTFDVDWKATAAANGRASSARTPGDWRLVLDRLLGPQGLTAWEGVQKTAAAVAEHLREAGYNVPASAAILPMNHIDKVLEDLQKAWKRDQERMDFEGELSASVKKHGVWRTAGESPALASQPSGGPLRTRVHKSGRTPSEYGSANPDELWAEVVAFAALKRKLSPSVKQLLKNVLGGKTDQPVTEAAKVSTADVARIQATPPAKLQTTTVDWGPRSRGQGRRSGGMVRGAMSAAPTGKKEYPDVGKTFSLTPEERKEVGIFPGHMRAAYLRARAAGYGHGRAATYAYCTDDECSPEETARLMSQFVEAARVKDGDAVDAGARGKRYEKAFFAALRLIGLKFQENGAQGAGGALWDFSPQGWGWTTLPTGAKVNLKVSSSRTLFTSTDFWKQVFQHAEGAKDIESRIRGALRKLKLTQIYWLKARSRDVEDQLMEAVSKKDKEALQDILQEKNWSAPRLTSYAMTVETGDDGIPQIIRLAKAGAPFVSIRVRVNKAAGNTAGWARTTSATPKKPYRPVAGQGKQESLLAEQGGVVSPVVRRRLPRGLGIPRARMPQISAEAVPDFLRDLQAKGVAISRNVAVDPRKLRPAQGELDLNKAREMLREKGAEALNKPVLISQDGYLLDGHHRWYAILLSGKTVRLKAIRIGLPIRALIPAAHRFDKSFTKGLGERARSPLRSPTPWFTS